MVLRAFAKNQSGTVFVAASPASVNAPELAITVGGVPSHISLLAPLRALPPPRLLPWMMPETFWANVSADCSSARIDISAVSAEDDVGLYDREPATRMSLLD